MASDKIGINIDIYWVSGWDLGALPSLGVGLKFSISSAKPKFKLCSFLVFESSLKERHSFQCRCLLTFF